jgi:hypothetical protein
MLDQFPSRDIDVFYGGWKLGPRGKGNAPGTLRGFFRFCIDREWLAKNPVTSDLKPPLGANRAANKPFTDEDLQRIVAACDQLEPISWSNGKAIGVACLTRPQEQDLDPLFGRSTELSNSPLRAIAAELPAISPPSPALCRSTSTRLAPPGLRS